MGREGRQGRHLWSSELWLGALPSGWVGKRQVGGEEAGLDPIHRLTLAGWKSSSLGDPSFSALSIFVHLTPALLSAPWLLFFALEFPSTLAYPLVPDCTLSLFLSGFPW